MRAREWGQYGSEGSERRRTYLAAHLWQTQQPRWASQSSAAIPVSQRMNSKFLTRCLTTSAVGGAGQRGQVGEGGGEGASHLARCGSC